MARKQLVTDRGIDYTGYLSVDLHFTDPDYAIAGFEKFEETSANGELIEYRLDDANGVDWETGVGGYKVDEFESIAFFYRAATPTGSSNGGASINLTAGNHTLSEVGGESVLAAPSLAIEQTVAWAKASPSLSITQAVVGKVSPALAIEQLVVAPRVGPALGIRQVVYKKAAPTLAIRQSVYAAGAVDQWRVGVIIGGADHSSRVLNAIRAEHEEDASSLATIEVLVTAGTFDADTWVGLSISMDYVAANSDGSERWRLRRFTGTVILAQYDPGRQVATLTASTDNQRRIYLLDRDQIATLVGGPWSPWVHDENSTAWQYCNDRLCTQQASLNADVHGQLSVRSWTPAATPAHTVTDAGHLADSLRVQKAERSALINVIEIDVDFRFPQLRQRDVGYRWSMGWSVCNQYAVPPPCPKATIADAINDAGWALVGPVQYTELPSSRWYLCNGRAHGWINSTGGNFATGVAFSLAARWVQTVTETQHITVSSPASIAANGEIAVDEAYGLEAPFDDAVWDESPIAETAPASVTVAGETLTARVAANGDRVFDADTLGAYRAAYDEVVGVLVASARREIAAAHRQNLITFEVPVSQAVELHQTLALDTANEDATGLVVGVTDELDVATGRAVSTVTVALSRTSGAGLPDPAEEAVDNTAPDDLAATVYEPNVVLETHIGGTLGSPPESDDWGGYVANLGVIEPGANVYENRFHIPTPEIAEGDRQAVGLSVSRAYVAQVRNDPLTESAA